jgi:hypothetical protein
VVGGRSTRYLAPFHITVITIGHGFLRRIQKIRFDHFTQEYKMSACVQNFDHFGLYVSYAVLRKQGYPCLAFEMFYFGKLINIPAAFKPKKTNDLKRRVLFQHRNSKITTFLDKFLGVTLLVYTGYDLRGKGSDLNHSVDNATASFLFKGGRNNVHSTVDRKKRIQIHLGIFFLLLKGPLRNSSADLFGLTF